MEEYISILLIVAPGFISRCLYDYLNPGVKESSEFQRTIIAITNSVPIISINFIIIYRFTAIKNIDTLLNSIKDLKVLLLYIALTLTSTIIYTLFWSLVHPKLTIRIINKIRTLKGYSEICDEKTVWDCMFNSDKGNQAILVIKNNKEIAKGFVKNWSFPQNDEKEISLEYQDIMEEHSDCFEEVDCVYYNIDKDILIKEYNLEKLHSKLNDVDKKEELESSI